MNDLEEQIIELQAQVEQQKKLWKKTVHQRNILFNKYLDNGGKKSVMKKLLLDHGLNHNVYVWIDECL